MLCPEVLTALATENQGETELAGVLFQELSARTIQNHRDIWCCDGVPAVRLFLSHGRGDVLRAALLTARRIPNELYKVSLFKICDCGTPTHRVLALRAVATVAELQELQNLLRKWFEKAPPAAQAAAAEVFAEKVSRVNSD